MEDLVILDYNSSKVHFFKCSPDAKIDDEYIQYLGFNLDECYWMLGKKINIVKHKGTLL